MTETKICPYLEITETEVRCRATDWGKTEDPETREVTQHWGIIPRAQICQCSSPSHTACSSFQRTRQIEEWEKEL